MCIIGFAAGVVVERRDANDDVWLGEALRHEVGAADRTGMSQLAR